MDEFEKFIIKNRKDLDRYSPPDRLWNGIVSGLRKRRISAVVWFSSAAMILIILGTSVLYHSLYNSSESSDRRNTESLFILKTNPNVIETEIYYNNLVKDLYDKAMPLLTSDPDLSKELNYDLSRLDTICMQIKRDLKDNISNQEVIEALINNYRIKIRLLNDMLDLLKQNENESEKTEKHAL